MIFHANQDNIYKKLLLRPGSKIAVLANLWTGTRGATRWATRTTDFLPRHITIVARTGRGIEQTSSDEGLW